MCQVNVLASPANIEQPTGVPRYSQLVRYTLTGFVGAVLLGLLLDRLQLQQYGFGAWAVRVLSGQGESLCEGLFAAHQRMHGMLPSIAEAYGWGKVTGMVAPWIIDAASRLLGMDVSGVGGFYIRWLYGMADQIGATIGGLLFIRRRTACLSVALRSWIAEPVMLASLVVIPLGAIIPLLGRTFGLRPDTQVLTALETGLANLSWLPPMVGWYYGMAIAARSSAPLRSHRRSPINLDQRGRPLMPDGLFPPIPTRWSC